jgi:hypothetical protein
MKNKESQVIFDWVVIILEITYSIAITMHVFFLIPGVKALIALSLHVYVSCFKIRNEVHNTIRNS